MSIGHEILYDFECILNPRKNKLGKLPLYPSQRSIKNLILIPVEDNSLTRRCHGFVKCKNVDEEKTLKRVPEYSRATLTIISNLEVNLMSRSSMSLPSELIVDYGGLNKPIDKTSWPLPRINKVIDSLEGNIYFWNRDLSLVYFQVALEENSQNLTAFIKPLGLYMWKRPPM